MRNIDFLISLVLCILVIAFALALPGAIDKQQRVDELEEQSDIADRERILADTCIKDRYVQLTTELCRSYSRMITEQADAAERELAEQRQ